MSPYEEALAKHRQWKPKPQYADLGVFFDQLVKNEFLPPAEQAERVAQNLRRIVIFAAAETHYYADLFAQLGLKPSEIGLPEDLAKLPVMEKHNLLDSQTAVTARNLPAVDALFGACELLSKAHLIAIHSKAKDARTHGYVHSKINSWRKLGNVERKFVELFNKLTSLRAGARYGAEKIGLSDIGEDALAIVRQEIVGLRERIRPSS